MTEEGNRQTLQASFSEKHWFKRRYHDGLRLVCVNKILVKITLDGNKFCSSQLTCDDNYRGVPIPIYFSRYLSNELRVLVLPKDVESFWPIVVTVLKYLTFYDDGYFEFATDNEKVKCIRKAGKHKALLKAFGYDVLLIPKGVVRGEIEDW